LNDISEGIRTEIMVVNRSCFGLKKHLKSGMLSRTTEIQLYKTLNKPIIMYGLECWTLCQSDEQKLDVFERKVLRRICGLIQESDTWRSRYISELNALHKEPKLTTAIIITRLRWAGHVQRMEDEQMPKRLLYAKNQWEKNVGSPRCRWLDEVNPDARRNGI
jgi:hypothetical protein